MVDPDKALHSTQVTALSQAIVVEGQRPDISQPRPKAWVSRKKEPEG